MFQSHKYSDGTDHAYIDQPVTRTSHPYFYNLNTTNDISVGNNLSVAGSTTVTGSTSIGGDLAVTGSLLVSGATTTLDTTNILSVDPIIQLNRSATTSNDSGILTERLASDIVDGSVFHNGALQNYVVGPPVVATLDATASATNDYYKNMYIKMTSGLASGEYKLITAYDGTTKEATLQSSFTGVPVATDTYNIYNRTRHFIGVDESSEQVISGWTGNTQDEKIISINEYSSHKFKQLELTTVNTDGSPPIISQAETNTWYVSKNGNNAWDGKTVNSPKLTLANALSASAVNDTIIILGHGTWSESLVTTQRNIIHGPNAILDGEQYLFTGCELDVDSLVNSSGGNVVRMDIAPAHCYIRANRIQATGSGHAFNITAGFLHVEAVDIDVENGYVTSPTTAQNVWLKVSTIGIQGTGGVVSCANGANINVNCSSIYDYSTATLVYSVAGAGACYANVTASEIYITNISNITNYCHARVNCSSITGTALELGVNKIIFGYDEFNFSKTIFVSKNGCDNFSGLTPRQSKLTISSGISVASVGDTVYILDAGEYTENITCATGVKINGPSCSIVGNITLVNESDIHVHSLSSATGTICQLNVASSRAEVHASHIIATSNANAFVANNGILLVFAGYIEVDTGKVVGETNSNYIRIVADRIAVLGAGVCFATTNSGDICCQVGCISGSTGATMFYSNAAGSCVIHCVASSVNFPILSNISANCECRLLTAKLSGGLVESGVGKVIIGYQDKDHANIIYVAKHGSNNNSGRNICAPKQGITGALAVAVAGDTIEILDGGSYTESISCVTNVKIVGKKATIIGIILLADGSDIDVYSIKPSTGVAVTMNVVGGKCCVRATRIVVAGSTHVLQCSNGLLELICNYIECENGFVVRDVSSDKVKCIIDVVSITGSGTVFGVTNGGNVCFQVGCAGDAGGGTFLSSSASATAYLSGVCSSANFATLSNLTASCVCNVHIAKILGTATQTGTPPVILSGDRIQDVALLSLLKGVEIDEISSDGTMAGNSDLAVPTEKAVVSYVASQITAHDSYLELTDTPASYTTALALVRVNAAKNGLDEAPAIQCDAIGGNSAYLNRGTSKLEWYTSVYLDQNLRTTSSVAFANCAFPWVCDAYTGDGALTIGSNRIAFLNKGSAGAFTLGSSALNGQTMKIVSMTQFAHTVTTAANLLNSQSNVITFVANRIGESVTLTWYGSYWYTTNLDGVTLS